jgi:hypothetical protein
LVSRRQDRQARRAEERDFRQVEHQWSSLRCGEMPGHLLGQEWCRAHVYLAGGCQHYCLADGGHLDHQVVAGILGDPWQVGVIWLMIRSGHNGLLGIPMGYVAGSPKTGGPVGVAGLPRLDAQPGLTLAVS